MANYGRHDPVSGLPLRVLDFLKSLDTIIDTAINERVDMVLFAGDTYKDRTPAPTYQREWGKRMMRLSQAGIPTLLLAGNHDVSPSSGRAAATQEFETLSVPHVRLVTRPTLLGPADLENLPLQVVALPWVSRSGLMAALEMSSADLTEVNAAIEERLVDMATQWLEQLDPSLPAIMAAHASVQGAVFGSERSVMLGSDVILPGSLVRDPRLKYVALGHIHKPQDLNENHQPPVIYPGSIERVDFGEAGEDRYFVIAQVEQGKDTYVNWRKLEGVRPFYDRYIVLTSVENIHEKLVGALPSAEKLRDAIVRLTVQYPREWEPLLEENALREYARETFEFHLVKHPLLEARSRLDASKPINSLTHLELLDIYWRASSTRSDEVAALQKLAEEIIRGKA